MRTKQGVALSILVSLLVGVGLIACSGGDSSTAPTPPPPPPPGGGAYRIEYSTFVGGNDFEEIREPTLLSGGRLLFGARTKSSNMPVRAGAVQPSYGGGEGDSYLAILSADGASLEAATFFGGSSMERPPYGIALTAGGDIVFTSGTTSPNIPTSGSSYQRNLQQPVPSGGDGYVCRISGDLSTLRWCTYTDGGWPRGGVILDGQDNVIVTGGPVASSFRTTPGAYVPPQDHGFTLKLNATGTSAIFATKFGGISAKLTPSNDISLVGIASAGGFPTTSGVLQATSTGPPDAWAAVLRGDGSGLLNATLFGGSATDLGEHPHVVFPDGSTLFGGITESTNLGNAGQLGGADGFLAHLDPSAARLEFLQIVGGSDDDFMLGPRVDAQGRIYVYGNTASRDFPTTADALQPSFAGGDRDAFLMVLDPGGSRIAYSTYLGGRATELVRGVAIGPGGELYIVGRTDSSDFPVTSGAFQTSRGGDQDGFVMKLVPNNE